MRNPRLFLRLFITAIILLTTVTSCNFPPKPAQFTEFYVSVKGSDTTGNGTKSKPWRHIQYAIDKASAKGGTTLRINVMKGIYEEELVIHKPLLIKGAGIGKATTWANDPLYPQEEVSIITVAKFDDNPNVFIENATSVNLQDLVIQFGGIRAVNTRFIMYNVEIPDSRGLFAVQIESCSMFYIEKSQIRTLGKTRSDYAVDIMASSGDIINTYMGDQFDHTINISTSVLGAKAPNPNTPLTIQSVNIRDSTIAGAKIYYADGVRIQGPANIKIVNTKITRTHTDAAAANTGTIYNPPYAGISAGGWLTEAQGSALIEIDGVTISGFDVGIGLNPEGFNVRVQNSVIAGIKYNVETKYNGYTNVSEPVIDFGGGPLGSAGKNDFAVQSPYAFYNNVPYDTYACFNEWNVPVNQVDTTRIYDELDVPSKGRVRWTCSADIILITPSRKPTQTALTQSRPTFTPTSPGRTVTVISDDLCYEGPGDKYAVVSAIMKNQAVELIGLGEGGEYFVVVNPVYKDPCWIKIRSVEFGGDPGLLPLIPLPTSMPVETITTPTRPR